MNFGAFKVQFKICFSLIELGVNYVVVIVVDALSYVHGRV